MPWLYLLRHGAADSGGDDPPLSQEGASRIEEEARGMVRLAVRFDAILTSPLRRARQTARLVAGALDSAPAVETAQALGSGCSLPALAKVLEKRKRLSSVLVVGHQPDLGTIAAGLIGARTSVPFEKGGLCCLQVAAWPPEPPGSLVFLLPPEVLRALGRRGE